MSATVRNVAKVAMVCGCVALVAGCATRRGNKTKISDDLLNQQPVDVLAGDHALDGRFAEGNRITDVQLQNVQFDYDSFQIKPSEMPKVDAAAEYLSKNAAVRAVIEGNCDERGSAEYNLALGEHRALAIRAALIGKGIDGTRIQTRSFGEERPLNPGHGEDAWSVNRRGEFALYR